MSNLNNCPYCKTSLIGDLIPKDQQKYYSATHFKREIGIEYIEKYDGVWEWECPDCHKRWDSEVKKLRHDNN